MSEDFIVIGKLGGSYGTSGFIKLHSFADPKTKIFDYSPLFLKDKAGCQEIVFFDSRVFKNGSIVVKIEGITNPEDARRFTNSEILVRRSSLPNIDEGFYWNDLIGLEVRLIDNSSVGRVDYLFNSGASDIMVVKRDAKKDVLIPYLTHVVLKVDLDNKYIIVDWELE